LLNHSNYIKVNVIELLCGRKRDTI